MQRLNKNITDYRRVNSSQTTGEHLSWVGKLWLSRVVLRMVERVMVSAGGGEHEGIRLE